MLVGLAGCVAPKAPQPATPPIPVATTLTHSSRAPQRSMPSESHVLPLLSVRINDSVLVVTPTASTTIKSDGTNSVLVWWSAPLDWSNVWSTNTAITRNWMIQWTTNVADVQSRWKTLFIGNNYPAVMVDVRRNGEPAKFYRMVPMLAE